MWYIRTKWVMIAVRIMMSNLATGRLKTDSWKQRLWIRGAFFFPGTKTHSSCRLRSFMCLRIKPLLTTCLSPKAITGEGAPFQHLNPYAPTKKKKKRVHVELSPTPTLQWHIFRTDSGMMKRENCSDFEGSLNVSSVRLTQFNRKALKTLKKKEILYSAAFIIPLRPLVTLQIKILYL